MTTVFIELGEVRRPVRFGFEGLLAYEKKTGRKALSDFAAMSDDLTQVSITMMVDLVWSGLYAGYHKEGIPPDFDDYAVASWLSDNPGAFETVMGVFAESFPSAEKKTTPRQVKAKATT